MKPHQLALGCSLYADAVSAGPGLGLDNGVAGGFAAAAAL